MSARDDLAQLLVKRAGDHIQMLDSGTEEDARHVSIGLSMNWAAIADITLAAGWRLPARVIDTEEELEVLPEGTVILNQFGDVFEVLPTSDSDLRVGFWLGDEAFEQRSVRLPAIALWEPGDGDE